MRKYTPNIIVRHRYGVNAQWILNDGGEGQTIRAVYTNEPSRAGFSLMQVNGPWTGIDSSDPDPRKWRVLDLPGYADERTHFNSLAVDILGVLNAVEIDRHASLKELFKGAVVGFEDADRRVKPTSSGASVGEENI